MGAQLALIVAMTILLSSEARATPSCVVNYWVATTGSDNNPGNQSNPFLTLDRARVAVQEDGNRGLNTICVDIEAGTYALSATLELGPNDSGSSTAPVIYQSAPGVTSPVIISGGIPVTNLTCSKATRICTASVSGLPAGEMPRQFYVNGQRAIRARSNYGGEVNLNYIRQPYGYRQIISQKLTHPELVEAVTTAQWKMMRCPVAQLHDKSLIMQNPCWNNANSYTSPNDFQLLSWLENAPQFMTVPGMWYLDPYTQQISYYNTGKTPPSSAILSVLETLIDAEGVAGNPVSNIVFQGLQFSYATWLEPNSSNGYASDQSGNILMGTGYVLNDIGHQQVTYKTHGNISLKYAHNITFNNDVFIHLGGAALDFDTGSQNNTITNNTFTDISATGIQLGGFTPDDQRPDSNDVTSGNLISNNSLSYTGQDYWDTAAIFVGFTTRTTITHNTITHTPWSSLAIGWGWGLLDYPSIPGVPNAIPGMWGTFTTPTIVSNNEISSNLFQTFIEKLWDGGAIYTNGAQGPNYANGLQIDLNVAEDKRPSGGGNVYYTDGGSKYVTLNQNVSLNNPVGTADFGPCFTGSSITPWCLLTGIIPYGSDVGGCLPVGFFTYTQNYMRDPDNFYEPPVCVNKYIPGYPIELSFSGNVRVTSASQVPQWILDQAGVQ